MQVLVKIASHKNNQHSLSHNFASTIIRNTLSRAERIEMLLIGKVFHTIVLGLLKFEGAGGLDNNKASFESSFY
ncbi:hypothetical protein ASU31_01405 [Pedobacter ginsenosidimutans]|uniref:Uncharacterized protein n=1 Tax=Pedobacter ginsenosidimutans TaxID=687842 RepID=A0A0T5VWE8_9SPHI|nr:hypothetical protein ASU31_01405 [Pedobacter ginsenosidimutans]